MTYVRFAHGETQGPFGMTPSALWNADPTAAPRVIDV